MRYIFEFENMQWVHDVSQSPFTLYDMICELLHIPPEMTLLANTIRRPDRNSSFAEGCYWSTRSVMEMIKMNSCTVSTLWNPMTVSWSVEAFSKMPMWLDQWFEAIMITTYDRVSVLYGLWTADFRHKRRTHSMCWAQFMHSSIWQGYMGNTGTCRIVHSLGWWLSDREAIAVLSCWMLVNKILKQLTPERLGPHVTTTPGWW